MGDSTVAKSLRVDRINILFKTFVCRPDKSGSIVVNEQTSPAFWLANISGHRGVNAYELLCKKFGINILLGDIQWGSVSCNFIYT